MQVPGNPSAAATDGPTQDNQPGPGQVALLMAAGEMHKQGKLTASADDQRAEHESDMNFLARAGSGIVNDKAFAAAMADAPPSKNIEDRRNEDPNDPNVQARASRNKQLATQDLLKLIKDHPDILDNVLKEFKGRTERKTKQ